HLKRGWALPFSIEWTRKTVPGSGSRAPSGAGALFPKLSGPLKGTRAMADGGFDPAVSPLRVFGAMLRFYRTQAGLSQTDLGARVHFSGDLVSKIEMGQRIATEEFTAACDGLPNLATGGALTELRG